MVPTPAKKPLGDLGRRIRHRVDREHVLVGQIEPDEEPVGGPGPARERDGRTDIVDPVGAVELHDRADLRLRHACVVDVADAGLGRHRREAQKLGDDRGLVAGLVTRRVHGLAVRRHRQRARRIGEQRDDVDRPAVQRVVEIVRVVDPDVGATDAGRGQLRIERDVLTAVGGGDERALAPGPANTMSRGSSPTSSVFTTREPTPSGPMFTMLTLSET